MARPRVDLGCGNTGHPKVAKKQVALAPAHPSRRSWVGGCHRNEWFLGCAMTSTTGQPVVAEKHVELAPAHTHRRSRVGGCHGSEWIFGCAQPSDRGEARRTGLSTLLPPIVGGRLSRERVVFGCAMASNTGHPMVAKKHVALAPAHTHRRTSVGGFQGTKWFFGVRDAEQREPLNRRHSRFLARFFRESQ